ncbi:hypothetical protein ABB37_05070 [Leptomonas pyrrhocoris]|uniref:EF-hand domain-containing protein n=1 Tax=Leptomonas pyrrhocoris TaxID=157538 RepID=A0A0M9G0V4_LEPPY|nr:hypothetical protein ABB37_05070 [Leptomonas pyrrhocoris]KPA80055.1 hypothetical protein ABB37_05070 [Leptomonas pyrrhocoris]|eukprot:XP_015658494.1 hypothetical protein ABB37_05070 [Leptomonas pyrrhocoris]
MFAVADPDAVTASPPADAATVDSPQRTRQYIHDHKLNELFAHLLQLVLYHKPENPRVFLADEVHRIRSEKVSSSLFTEKDLETMFEMIDVTSQKWITVQQLRNTCRNLSTGSSGTERGGNGAVNTLSEEQEAAITRAGDAAGHVSLEKFKEVLASLLLTRNMWSAKE